MVILRYFSALLPAELFTDIKNITLFDLYCLVTQGSPGWMKPRFYEAYAPFRERQPDDMVGNSILVFHVD